MADKVLAGIEPGGLCQIDVAETVEAGDLVGYSTGWKLAKQAATAIPASGIVNRATTYVSGGDNKVQLHTRGIVREASGLTAGAPVYLAAGGDVSATAGANFAQVVGIALSATEWVLAINAGVGAIPLANIAALAASGAAAAAGAFESETYRNSVVTKLNEVIAALKAHGIVVKA